MISWGWKCKLSKLLETEHSIVFLKISQLRLYIPLIYESNDCVHCAITEARVCSQLGTIGHIAVKIPKSHLVITHIR